MKSKTSLETSKLRSILWTIFLAILLVIGVPSGLAQGTAFTYQGRLNEAGQLANGYYDLSFSLFNASGGGGQVGSTITNTAAAVSNGLFSVTLDFGPGVFTGGSLWVEIGVRTNGSAGGWSRLSPRQAILPAPYAITARNVSGPINGSSIAAGTIGSAQLAVGAVTAANIASNSITASQLAAGAAAANLNSLGQSGVPSGGMILTANATDNNLIGAGYVKLGRLDTADRWEQRASGTPPGTRQRHTAVWTGSEMLVWGGYNGTYLGDGACYDPVTGVWRPMSSTGAPTGRDYHTAVWTGTDMLVWGGESGSLLSTGGRYNPASDTWTSLPTTGAPSARYMHTAVWTGTEMLIWGGYNGSGTSFNDGGRYSPALNSWAGISTAGAPSGRYLHSAVWSGSEMLIWGGYNGTYYNNGGRYNPTANTWTAIPTSGAPAARYQHSAVWTGNEMLVWGGVYWPVTTYFNDGGRYDPVANAWTAIPSNGAPLGRYLHASVWTGNEMLVWGGTRTAYLNDGGRFNPSSNTWSPISTNGAPLARALHSAVWTGTGLIAWGGYSGSGYLNDGGRYSPAAGNWVALTATAPPAPRQGATAVWSGSEVIIWGGSYNDGSEHYFNNGGRYNPTANNWAPVTSTNAPSARREHTAVWTGSEMIVWGGYDGGNLNTGARYNPTANTWTGVTATGAPSARREHMAVWTGSEMIIWGGIGATGSLLTGARYNPSSNTWTALATNNAAGASGPAAVWTGSEMLVWNGSSGGRYKPATDSWLTVEPTGAPTERADHTVLWTGNEMIVWGGWYKPDVDSRVNRSDGGRYSPVANRWTPIPATSGTGRFSHTAVWTGSDMLVWGGAYATGIGTQQGFLHDGFRYNPAANTYTAVTTDGEPEKRCEHIAVWTGTEMILWGGYWRDDIDGSYHYPTGTYSYAPPQGLYLYQRP